VIVCVPGLSWTTDSDSVAVPSGLTSAWPSVVPPSEKVTVPSTGTLAVTVAVSEPAEP